MFNNRAIVDFPITNNMVEPPEIISIATYNGNDIYITFDRDMVAINGETTKIRITLNGTTLGGFRLLSRLDENNAILNFHYSGATVFHHGDVITMEIDYGTCASLAGGV